MESSSPHPVRFPRLPWKVWAALGLALAVIAAVTIFRVPTDVALSYGLFGFIILAHSVMHAGHGSHGAHAQHRQGDTEAKQDPATEPKPASTGGCH